jgi:hypothetical protein
MSNAGTAAEFERVSGSRNTEADYYFSAGSLHPSRGVACWSWPHLLLTTAPERLAI